MRQHAGFTLIELITIVVILGILAVVAVPRLGNNEYRGQEFRERTVSALRYAQKTAVSHRRRVCVSFSATTVTLSIDTNKDLTCETALLLPGSNNAVVQSGDAGKAFFSPVPGNLNFEADGVSVDTTISVSGQAAILVVGATGYVN